MLQGGLSLGAPPNELQGQETKTMSTVQLVPSNVVLMKSDAYQGKQEVKDWWSETEYMVVCQVTDGVPTYEVKVEAGSIKTVHRN